MPLSDSIRRTIRRAALTVAAVLVVAAGLPIAAGGAPGEDGAHPDPPGFYDPSPLGGWMTERASDRVYDIAQIGNTIYVAGGFAGIRPSPGGPVTGQANLVAFDATTGSHLGSFDPVVDSSVYSLAVAPDGSRLYAGGAFYTVNGGNHRRLAALDPVTGDPVAGFDADVSGGSVRSIVALGSDLYVGGNFGSVEGVLRNRLARLAASSGAVDPAWAPTALGGSVLTLETAVDESRIYAGGRFDSIDAEPASAELVALDAVDGSVDPGFAAQPGREVFDLVATGDGRVYVAEGGPLGQAEAYDQSGTLLARWDTDGDVQAVEQIGDLVYFGGHDFGPEEEDNVAVVNPDDLTLFDVEVFKPPSAGGDGVWTFHATAGELWVGGQSSSPYYGFARFAPIAPPPPRVDVVPVGSAWSYLDDGSDQGSAWRLPGFDDGAWASGPAQLGFGDGDEATALTPGHTTYWFRREFPVTNAAGLTAVRLALLADDGAVAYVNGTEVARHNMPGGAIDAATRASATAFGTAESTFTMFDISDGTLVEGTNTLAVEIHQVHPSSSDISFDARVTAVAATPDTSPPQVPEGLEALDVTDRSFTLEWEPSSDDVGVDHYEVFQGTTSTGTTAATSMAVDGLTPATTYQMTVEAVDAAGNRSTPSSPLAVVTEDAPPVSTELIAPGATWRYLDDGSDQGDAWRQPGFDDSGWSTGPAQLGRGDGDEATVMAGGPVTYWLRHPFSVASAGVVSALDLELLADDGAVVYLNGVEVARDNMPGGPVSATSNALTYRWGAAETAFREIPLATAPLVDGVNVLAVEVHQAPGSSDLSFDARLESTAGVVDTTPPSVPGGVAQTTADESSLGITWTPSSDDTAVDHYEFFVDGDQVGSGPSPPATLTGLAPSTTYSIEVEALDRAGNRSGRSAPIDATTADPAAGPVTLMAQGSVWSYLDDGSDPGLSWVDAGFDAAAWGAGAAQIGFGDGDEVTTMTPGHVTYRFLGTFPVTSASTITDLTVDLLADDGALVYVNGVEVVRDNMPAGPVGPDTLASTYRFGSAERTYNSFVIPDDVLVDGLNTIAVEVHQANPGSKDVSFDLGLRAVQ